MTLIYVMSTYNTKGSSANQISRQSLGADVCEKAAEPQGPIAEEISSIRHVLAIQEELLSHLKHKIDDVCLFPPGAQGVAGSEKLYACAPHVSALISIKESIIRRNDMIREMIEAVQL